MAVTRSCSGWLLLLAAAFLFVVGCDGDETSQGTTMVTTSSGGSAAGGSAGHAPGGGGTAGAGGANGGGGAAAGGAAPLAEVSVWLIGDSTVATGSGWGDFLQPLVHVEATVINRARSGESTLSFYEAESNNLWSGSEQGVLPHLVAGDYVLIQFGHNDEHEDVEHHTDPGEAPDYQGTYRQYLELYIDETRGAGATPILVTPVSRMTFSSDGSHYRSHGDYPAAMIKTAEDNSVALLDLEAYSHEQFDALGEEQTLALFSDGVDRTHFPPEKAWRVAEFVAELLAASPSPLAAYVP